jgi:parallel beta-helix repeat protein
LPDVVNLKINLSAVIIPAQNNDISEGYAVGSRWINTTTNQEYVCLDNTSSFAIWKLTSGTTTTDISEGIDGINLYYTNDRFDTRFLTKTTSNLNEGTNLYYTSARFDSRFASKTTSDLSEGSNIYYTNSRFDTRLLTKTTSDITEGSNLYFTEGRVSANSDVTLNTIHRSNSNNPHSITKYHIGLENVQNIKMNFGSSTNPLVTNDTNEGYSVGSQWVNIVNNKKFICLDSTSNSAIWKDTTKVSLYDAIVDINGLGDYTSIASAFNAGHTSVFVKSGVYSETTDIDVPNGGILVGETASKVIIVLSGATIKIDGSSGIKETVGTINITKDTTIVTGIGTTFMNLSVGNYILLSQNFHEISSIESDTSLTLKSVYRGISLTNVLYNAQQMYSGIFIKNVLIVNSLGTGLYVRGIIHSVISSITIKSCNKSIDVIDCGSMQIGPISSMDSNGTGLDVINTYSTSLVSCEVYNSDDNGINFSGSCQNIVVNGALSSNNDGIGINFSNNCNNINIVDTIISKNSGKGINTDPSTGNIIIGNCTITENGSDGIDFNGTDNLVSNCIILDNLGIGVNGGNAGVICNSQIKNNGGDGICLFSDSLCTINGNRIINNAGVGINLDGDENIISDNTVEGNLIGIKLVGANSCTISNNIIKSTVNQGITLELSSMNNVINGNRIIGASVGINVLSNCNYCSISCNTITGSTSHGIYLGSNESIIIGNHCRDNGSDGCHIASNSSNNIIMANYFKSNTGINFNDNGTVTDLPPILINRLDTRDGSTLKIGDQFTTKLELGRTGITTDVSGPLNVLEGLSVTGTVNGRNITTDGTNLDNHLANVSNPHSVTASQIGNSTAQWNANKIQGTLVDTSIPSDGDTLIYDSEVAKFVIKKNYEDETIMSLFDDFYGASLSSSWVTIITDDGLATIENAVGGQLKLSSGTVTNGYSQISTGKKIMKLINNPSLKFRVKINSTTNTIVSMGLISDDNNLVDFKYDASGTGSNWLCRTTNSGTITSTDSFTLADTNWHIFEIKGTFTDVKFYIDGSIVTTNTTNLYTSLMKVFIKQTSKTGVSQYVLCDYIKMLANRET